MEGKISQFFESVGSVFSGVDQIPWCDRDIISGCEREVAEAAKGDSDDLKHESIMRLSWALVHSRQPEDVQRGIAMLEASLANSSPPLQQREKVYLLAVGTSFADAKERSGDSDDLKNESIMRLSWALVHSRQPDDVQRGIAMLEASLANSSPLLQQREKVYLLAVGYYRSGDYARSRQLVERCLEIAPDWRQALVLKKTIED